MNTATARVQPEYAGSASATVNVTQQVGGSIGTALLSTVAIAATIAALPAVFHGSGPQFKTLEVAAQVHGYTTAFWWAAALFGIGTVIAALVLPSGRPERATSEQPELAVAV
jgi:hypothetical protein